MSLFILHEVIYQKKILLKEIEILLPVFSSRSSVVLILTFKFLIYPEYFFVCGGKKGVPVSFFACICLIFLTPFIEQTIFTPLYMFVSFTTYPLTI